MQVAYRNPQGVNKLQLVSLRTSPMSQDAVRMQHVPASCGRPITLGPKNRSRFAWLHVPKAGTTFGNTLVQLAANASGCGNLSDISQEWQRPEWFRTNSAGLGMTRHYFWEKRKSFDGHDEISPAAWDRYKGHFVGFFRNPAHRAHSAYHHFPTPLHSPDCTRIVSEREYAERVRGTMVKMVAGQASGLDCHVASHQLIKGMPYKNLCDQRYEPDVPLALSRLRHGFSFVGLTEAWALSICLFHAVFGGPCMPVEFSNSRPGHYARKTASSPGSPGGSGATAGTTGLPRGVTPVDDGTGRDAFAGYVDEYDWEFYRAVEQRFYRDLERYNVSEALCHELCPSAPRGAFREAIGEGYIERAAREGWQALQRQAVQRDNEAAAANVKEAKGERFASTAEAAKGSKPVLNSINESLRGKPRWVFDPLEYAQQDEDAFAKADGSYEHEHPNRGGMPRAVNGTMLIFSGRFGDGNFPYIEGSYMSPVGQQCKNVREVG